MIERHPCERRRARDVCAQEVIPRDGTRDGAAVASDIRNNHNALDRRNARGDLGDLVEYRQCLGVVVVAVDCDQQPGLDLPEAIDDALSTEVRRARRPHRPQTRRGEHPDDRFRHVGDDGTDTSAGDTARVRHRLLRARHVVEKLPVTDPALDLVFAPEDERIGVRHRCAVREQILGKIDPRIREESRARHLFDVGRRSFAGTIADEAGERPQRSPEALDAVDRPLMQRCVVIEANAKARSGLVHEARDDCRIDALL